MTGTPGPAQAHDMIREKAASAPSWRARFSPRGHLVLRRRVPKPRKDGHQIRLGMYSRETPPSLRVALVRALLCTHHAQQCSTPTTRDTEHRPDTSPYTYRHHHGQAYPSRGRLSALRARGRGRHDSVARRAGQLPDRVAVERTRTLALHAQEGTTAREGGEPGAISRPRNTQQYMPRLAQDTRRAGGVQHRTRDRKFNSYYMVGGHEREGTGEFPLPRGGASAGAWGP